MLQYYFHFIRQYLKCYFDHFLPLELALVLWDRRYDTGPFYPGAGPFYPGAGLFYPMDRFTPLDPIRILKDISRVLLNLLNLGITPSNLNDLKVTQRKHGRLLMNLEVKAPTKIRMTLSLTANELLAGEWLQTISASISHPLLPS